MVYHTGMHKVRREERTIHCSSNYFHIPEVPQHLWETGKMFNSVSRPVFPEIIGISKQRRGIGISKHSICFMMP